MENKIMSKKLKARFAELSHLTTQESKIDPLVVAKFTKDHACYYAIAYDDECNMLLCYISSGEDTQGMPIWVYVSALEQSLFPGRPAQQDISFAETPFSRIVMYSPPAFPFQCTEDEKVRSIQDGNKRIPA